MDLERKIKFYKSCGLTDNQISKKLEQQRKTEQWEKKVLERKPILEKLAKIGPILKWTEVGLVIFTFILSTIEPVENFIKGHLVMFAWYLGTNFLLLTIGFILSQICIHNETYYEVKKNKEHYEEIKKQLGE